MCHVSNHPIQILSQIEFWIWSSKLTSLTPSSFLFRWSQPKQLSSWLSEFHALMFKLIYHIDGLWTCLSIRFCCLISIFCCIGSVTSLNDIVNVWILFCFFIMMKRVLLFYTLTLFQIPVLIFHVSPLSILNITKYYPLSHFCTVEELKIYELQHFKRSYICDGFNFIYNINKYKFLVIRANSSYEDEFCAILMIISKCFDHHMIYNFLIVLANAGIDHRRTWKYWSRCPSVCKKIERNESPRTKGRCKPCGSGSWKYHFRCKYELWKAIIWDSSKLKKKSKLLT